MAGVPPFEAEGDTQSIVASEENAQFHRASMLVRSRNGLQSTNFLFVS